jgi:MFS family permease
MAAPLLRTPPGFVGLILGQLCMHACMAGLRMAAPLSLLRAGQSEVLVGPLLALFSVGSVLSALPAGRLSDRHGYHLPVRIAVVSCALAGLLALFSQRLGATGYVALCAAGFAAGAGANTGLITILRSAGKGARDTTEMKRVFSWLGLAPALSNFVGPLGAGVLIDRYGFRAAFLALTCLPLGTLVASAFVPRELARAEVRKEEKRRIWDLLATPLLRRLLLVNWFTSASWDVHSFLVPVLGYQRGLSASAIGSVLGAFALAVTLVRLLLPLLARRAGDAQVLTAALLLVTAAFTVYPFTRGVLSMIACALLLGLALGASQPMVMTALHRITPKERHGEALGLRSMAMNTSSAILPLGFGVAGATLGTPGLFWLMAVLTAGGVFVARRLDREA